MRFAFLLISFAILGCVRIADAPGLTPTLPAHVSPTGMRVGEPLEGNLDDILTSECTMLQFNGLTPRVTTSSQALRRLEANQHIVELDTYEVSDDGNPWVAEVNGKYRAENSFDSPTELDFTLHFSEPPGNQLDSIFVSPAHPIALRDVVRRCGDPSHVVSYITYGLDMPEDYWTVNLWWEERGLYVRTFGILSPNSAPPGINENLQVDDYLQMMAPFSELDVPRWQTFSPWEGYQTFEYYEVAKPT